MVGAFRPCRGPAGPPERFDGPFLDLVCDRSDPLRQRLGGYREDTLRSAVGVVQHRRHLSREIRPLLVTDIWDRHAAGAQVAKHRHERLGQSDVHDIPPVGITTGQSLELHRDGLGDKHRLMAPVAVEAKRSWYACRKDLRVPAPVVPGRPDSWIKLCDDIHATLAELQDKGVEVARGVSDQGWGLLAAVRLPDGGELPIYQPRHP